MTTSSSKDKKSSSSTLRHRRNKNPGEGKESATSEESVPLIEEKNDDDLQLMDENKNNNDDDNIEKDGEEEEEEEEDDDDYHDHGYVLTPLVERSLLMRLDVGPFLIGYIVLIYLDYYGNNKRVADRDGDDDDDDAVDLSILLQPITWVFGLVLISHAMLVLMQQWNVSIKSMVGYTRGSTTVVVAAANNNNNNNKQQQEAAEALIKSWTHCLVEEKSSSTNQRQQQQQKRNSNNNKSSNQQQQQRKSADTSSDAGIAPVTIRSVIVENNNNNNNEIVDGANNNNNNNPILLQYKVAIVRFHDINFRCPIVPKSLDQDVILWRGRKETTTTTGNSSTSKRKNQPKQQQQDQQDYYPKIRTKLSFHRVRYPINLPTTFYTNWRGHTSLESVLQCHQLYGANMTSLQLPAFAELLFQQLLAPFFLFQVFCVALWSLDEYWYYAIFTLMALLCFESTVAYNQLQSLQRLRNASRQNKQQKLWVYRSVRRAAAVGHNNNNNNNPTPTSSWVRVSAQDLVPGDIVSVTEDVPAATVDSGHNTVPADLLLLSGNAVADEALLTGESIPQIKVPYDPSSTTGGGTTGGAGQEAHLHMQESKQSVLFGGTVLLSADNNSSSSSSSSNNSSDKNDEDELLSPPDNGIVGLVLQTGFETAQGSLLRTIAHSSKSVDGVHTWDTFVFIFLLVCCAMASASLVLRDGWEDETRNRFRLVLHVIIIITSVVPPELPMELSLAVTNSVTDLMKRCRVFCTEHYRIPWAGLVDVCCFDKTGTITSDQMRLKGVRVFLDDGLEYLSEDSALVSPGDADADTLPWSTVRIMAACNSLALRVTRSKSGTRTQLIGDPLEQAVLKDTGYQLGGSNVLIPTKTDPDRPKSISILHRFAFASQLKRMTVLVTEEKSAEMKSNNKSVIWALTKGAPETILKLLTNESIPPDYEDIYTYHMSRGRRVLAMAFRNLGVGKSIRALKEEGRDKIEKKLTFAGFLILDCPLKPDSKAIISEIRRSDNRVVMITGDAVLTAAEISKQVGIIATEKDRTTYWLQEVSGKVSSDGPLSSFGFVPLLSKKGSDAETPASMLSLSKDSAKLQSMAADGTASFCLTGDMLVKVATAAVSDDDVNETSALARMNEKSLLLHSKSQNALKELVKVVSVFARHAPHQKEAVVAAFNLSGHYTLYCGDGTNDTPSLKRAHVGVSIISAPDAESKQRKANASMSRLKKEKKKGKKGTTAARARSMEETMRLLREAQEEIDQIELGDASMASPFTSRQVSIVCCKNVLQRGRCTLVTMLQIYKILGINCLVNAMVLSTLSIYGVKQGERQLTVLGMAVAALFLFVTRAQPLETMSSARPPSSVLSLHVLLSITIQFAIHFGAILLACMTALAFVDPYDPSIVADGPFNPNVLNTCTFLLTVLATINTFAVNYRGRPFTENLQENKLLMRSLLACYGTLFLCAFEAFPPLNDLLQLSSFPVITEQSVSISENSWLLENEWLVELLKACDFPLFMSLLMVADTALTFVVEKFLVRTFEC